MAKKNQNKDQVIEKVKIEAVEGESAVNVVREETDEPISAIVYGVVINCAKLNVRKKPSKKADVIAVIAKGAEVKIDDARSTKDFYYVESSDGYCAKEFIKIK